MPLYEFEGKSPDVDESAWIAPSADIIGDVKIGAECYVGWQAVLRGDHGSIMVEDGSAIEEGVIIHTSPDFICRIGREVTVGHGAMLHNATIEPFAVIGVRATVCDYATVGEWSIIGEMGLVKARQKVPRGVIGVGHPVEIIGMVEERHKERWTVGKKRYRDFTKRNLKGLRKIAL